MRPAYMHSMNIYPSPRTARNQKLPSARPSQGARIDLASPSIGSTGSAAGLYDPSSSGPSVEGTFREDSIRSPSGLTPADCTSLVRRHEGCRVAVRALGKEPEKRIYCMTTLQGFKLVQDESTHYVIKRPRRYTTSRDRSGMEASIERPHTAGEQGRLLPQTQQLILEALAKHNITVEPALQQEIQAAFDVLGSSLRQDVGSMGISRSGSAQLQMLQNVVADFQSKFKQIQDGIIPSAQLISARLEELTGKCITLQSTLQGNNGGGTNPLAKTCSSSFKETTVQSKGEPSLLNEKDENTTLLLTRLSEIQTELHSVPRIS